MGTQSVALSTDEDVVDGDVDELDEIADKAHDEETHSSACNDLLVLLLV